MCVRAVLPELAVTSVIEVLASLSLVVVVGNVEHLHVDFFRESLDLYKMIISIIFTSSLPLNSCSP